jgi:hypothetical protein
MLQPIVKAEAIESLHAFYIRRTLFSSTVAAAALLFMVQGIQQELLFPET